MAENNENDNLSIRVQNLNRKDIIIIKFEENSFRYNEILSQIKNVKEALNKDGYFFNRVIALGKGVSLETLSEDNFINIWKDTHGKESLLKSDKENIHYYNPNQLSIFNKENVGE